MGESATTPLRERAPRLDLTTTMMAALATAATALGALALVGLAVFSDADGRGWVAALGAAALVAGWFVAFWWWRRHPNEVATSGRVGRRLLVAGWGLWLVIAGDYAAATLALVTPDAATTLWCEFPNDDSYYGSASIRWLPFGLECAWPVDAAGQVPEFERDATRTDRRLAFPNASPVINAVFLVGLVALLTLTVQDQRRRQHA